jgi:hypothetical protein
MLLLRESFLADELPDCSCDFALALAKVDPRIRSPDMRHGIVVFAG